MTVLSPFFASFGRESTGPGLQPRGQAPNDVDHGGPARLVVPGIKRLLAQSKTGYLGAKWLEEYAIPGADGRGKTAV